MPNANSTTASGLVEPVLTPGGMREKSQVHAIEPGVAVDFDREGEMFQLVRLGSGRILLELPAKPRAAAPQPDEFWGVCAYWENKTGTPLDRFSTDLQVPPPPEKPLPGAAFFLGSGIEPEAPETDHGPSTPDEPILLKPVLQWGESAAGGGSHWSVASWYLTSSGYAFHTEPETVSAGATLYGLVEMFVQADDLFSYQCEFKDHPATHLPVLNVAELRKCEVGLQTCGVKELENLPETAKASFLDIEVRAEHVPPPVAWTTEDKDGKLGVEATAEEGPAKVDICFGPGAA